jgi:hypothetical protein
MGGNTVGPIIVWCRFHTEAETEIMFGENVPEFSADLLRVNLPKHDVFRLPVNPSDCGFHLIRRPRALFLMTLKGRIAVSPPWEAVYAALVADLQRIRTAPEDCLLANQDGQDRPW